MFVIFQEEINSSGFPSVHLFISKSQVLPNPLSIIMHLRTYFPQINEHMFVEKKYNKNERKYHFYAHDCSPIGIFLKTSFWYKFKLILNWVYTSNFYGKKSQFKNQHLSLPAWEYFELYLLLKYLHLWFIIKLSSYLSFKFNANNLLRNNLQNPLKYYIKSSNIYIFLFYK